MVLHLQALAAAAAAQTAGLLSNRPTRTTPVLVLSKNGNENRMH
jgi:hypothetical protein